MGGVEEIIGDPLEIALHEAAHAVIAEMVGLRPVRVTIDLSKLGGEKPCIMARTRYGSGCSSPKRGRLPSAGTMVRHRPGPSRGSMIRRKRKVSPQRILQ
jgi:hypothetical protein